MSKIRKLSLVLVMALLGIFSFGSVAALADGDAGVKVEITTEREGDILTASLSMKNISFNALSIALGYDTTILTPVRADGTTADQAQDIFEMTAPTYEGPGSGWLVPMSADILFEKTAGAMQYTFFVEPGGEDVDPDTNCFTAPASGTEIFKVHFKVSAGATLRYSSLRLLQNHFNNQTGIKILDSDLNSITDVAVVNIDLTNVAQPDTDPGDKPGGGSGGGGGGGGDKPDTGNGSANGGAKPDTGNGNTSGTGGSGSGNGNTDGTGTAVWFNDVSGHWAETGIMRLANAGVIFGDEKGNFLPENQVTRAEMAAMLVRAYNLTNTVSPVVFDDIAAHWAEKEISIAAGNGFFQGEGKSFHPNDAMTREELAVVVARVMKLPQEGVNSFADAAQCSEWARGAVAAVAKTGIVNGYPDGKFGPKDLVTRAEAATIVDRCLV